MGNPIAWSILLLVLGGGPSEPPQSAPTPPAHPPGIEVTQSVSRYSEYPLTDFQTRVMNEVSKVTSSCRIFYALFGRWPHNLGELKAKTEGIDYDVFLDRARIEPQPYGGPKLKFFDGKYEREYTLVSDDTAIDPSVRADAAKPEFKIRFK